MRARALFRVALAAFALSIIGASPVLAQVGVMGGLTLGSMSVSHDTEDQEFKLQPGYAAGLFFGVPLKKTTKIALQIEALWMTKGVRISAAGFAESRGGVCASPVRYLTDASTSAAVGGRASTSSKAEATKAAGSPPTCAAIDRASRWAPSRVRELLASASACCGTTLTFRS